MPGSVSIIATELLAICERDGKLLPEAVVQAAEPEDSPLHHRFEWDDAIAGHEHRLSQARHLIRKVKVQVITNPKLPPVYTRAFVHIPDELPDSVSDGEPGQSGAYYPHDVVAASPILSRIALRAMERRWRELRRTYEAHVEFWDLIQQELAARTNSAASPDVNDERKTG